MGREYRYAVRVILRPPAVRKTERGGRSWNYIRRANNRIRVKIATGITSSMV